MSNQQFRPKHAAMAALLLALPLAAAPLHTARAQEFVLTATEAPPPLPDYDQPPLPSDGYIWTPGYWAYGPVGYFWVPGTWVLPPSAGLLWTPGWWGFANGAYAFNEGYWGDHVGYYGGIDYGFGYVGDGYEGAYWRNGGLFYNRAVNRFGGVRIANVYERTVVVNRGNRFSFNGPNGVNLRPMPTQIAFMHARHVAATPLQVQHIHLAIANPALRAAVNHGRPAILATPRPAAFRGPGVVGTGFHAPAPAPHPIAVAPRPIVGHPVAPAPRPIARPTAPRAPGAYGDSAPRSVRPGEGPGYMQHGPGPVTAPYRPGNRPEVPPEGRPQGRPEGFAPRAAAPAPRPPMGAPAPHPAPAPHEGGNEHRQHPN